MNNTSYMYDVTWSKVVEVLDPNICKMSVVSVIIYLSLIIHANTISPENMSIFLDHNSIL